MKTLKVSLFSVLQQRLLELVDVLWGFLEGNLKLKPGKVILERKRKLFGSKLGDLKRRKCKGNFDGITHQSCS